MQKVTVTTDVYVLSSPPLPPINVGGLGRKRTCRRNLQTFLPFRSLSLTLPPLSNIDWGEGGGSRKRAVLSAGLLENLQNLFRQQSQDPPPNGFSQVCCPPSFSFPGHPSIGLGASSLILVASGFPAANRRTRASNPEPSDSEPSFLADWATCLLTKPPVLKRRPLFSEGGAVALSGL
jgi:hypothetical protein